MGSRVSIKDVAREAKTSIATVSNVLNHRKNVRPELAQRVLRTAQELGYCVNPIARSLKIQKSHIIGIIVSDMACIFFTPMLCTIQKALYARGYAVMICDAGNDPAREAEYARTLESRQADGIIRIGTGGKGCEEVYADIVDRGTPVVSLEHDYTSQGVDSVLVDNRECAYRATNHLIDMGCRRIAHITISPCTGLANERFMGYRDALETASIPFDEALLLHGDFSPISGYNAIHSLIHSGVAFDGVFAANDQMAVGALRALGNAGIPVPGEVKLMGFDNTFISSIVDPALTTVSVSPVDMGRIAVDRILARLDGAKSPAARIPLDYELVIRKSTMLSARTRWEMERW